jgi:hypothetical protein
MSSKRTSTSILQSVEPPELRQRIIRTARKRLVWSRKCLLLGVLSGAAPSVLVLGVMAAGWGRAWFPRNTLIVIQAVMVGLLGMGLGIASQFMLRRPFQRYLREELNRHGIPVCPGCGYDLRAQVEPRCPECGLAVTLPAPADRVPSG